MLGLVSHLAHWSYVLKRANVQLSFFQGEIILLNFCYEVK